MERFLSRLCVLTPLECHSSTMKTVDWRANDPELRWLSKVDWASGLYHPMLRKFWDCFFYGDFDRYGKQRYRDHYEEVKSIVPADNLLEYKVGSGWGPLCEFLGHEVPKRKFPRGNDTDDFIKRCRTRNRNQMMNVIFRVLVVGGSMAATALSAAMAYQQFAPSRFTSVSV